MHSFFRGPICNEAYTLTLGDRGENEKGMQIIGKAAEKGLTVAQLVAIEQKLTARGMECRLISLGQLLPGVSTPDAAVLVVCGGVNGLLKESKGEDMVYKELRSMPKDKTYRNKYGNVVNKHARHNNTMWDDSHQEPDIDHGKGTVVSFDDYQTTRQLRNAIAELIDVPRLVGELNHYFDAVKCGIDYHGDEERKIVVGTRFGYGANGFLLKFHWYKNGHPVGLEGHIKLNAGDVYMMSEKAVGFDTFKCPESFTLRHAASKDKAVSGQKRKACNEEGPKVL